MCTAISYRTKDHYFGRNLDVERPYGEELCITPRRFPLHFRKMGTMENHHAMIGMAVTADGYPLYFDATNEKGLSMAGLNFPGNAVYKPETEGKDNVSPFEIIPWILGQCARVEEAKALCEKIHVTDIAFSASLPLSPLHWIIADAQRSITVEAVEEGVRIYDNPVGVLTNNPPFDMQMFYLNRYRGVGTQTPENRFCRELPLAVYSNGMGGLGIPGDLSSMSRFVKAAFTKLNSRCGEGEAESVGQFFHILASVEQQRGCVLVAPDAYEITEYMSCVNTDKGIYYYTTYGNRQISAVNMHHENLDGAQLIHYPLVREEQVLWQN